MTTGRGRPGSTFCVCALNALQNSIILRPRCPRAGPIGGLGFALPAGTCNFTKPTIFLANLLSLRVHADALSHPPRLSPDGTAVRAHCHLREPTDMRADQAFST